MTIEDVIKKSILPLAFMVFWFWTVSYTHLDVYKRQDRCRSLQKSQFPNRLQVCSLGKLCDYL